VASAGEEDDDAEDALDLVAFGGFRLRGARGLRTTGFRTFFAGGGVGASLPAVAVAFVFLAVFVFFFTCFTVFSHWARIAVTCSHWARIAAASALVGVAPRASEGGGGNSPLMGVRNTSSSSSSSSGIVTLSGIAATSEVDIVERRGGSKRNRAGTWMVLDGSGKWWNLAAWKKGEFSM